MLRKLKNVFIVIAMVFVVLVGYVMIVNRNSVNMTGRQKVLKAFYPVLVWMNKRSNKNRDIMTHEQVIPPVSFFR